MTIKTCNTKNALIRDGTSQTQRQLPQLHPRYARIDEHSLSDFMDFAANYGEQLQYFDAQNKASGDWRDFFDRDVASVISIVANKDNSEYKVLFNSIKKFFDDTPTTYEIHQSGVLEAMFNLVFQLSSEFNDWVLKALAEGGFKRHLHRLVTSQLKESLSKTLSAYKYALDQNWIGNATDPSFLFNYEQEKIFKQAYSSLWNEDSNGALYTLQDWLDNPDVNSAIYRYTADSSNNSLKQTGESLLSWLESFLQAQSQLINDAPSYLFEVIHHWPGHKPHMALYITFIRLFKYAQIHLNSLTGRHLDHYYKDILGFKPLASTDDRVHILFELAKQSNQHLLKQGTLLKAGFDEQGNPVQYKLNTELAVNKANIKDAGDIKSVYIDRTDGQGHRIYSAAIANSKDGKGKEFSENEPKWKPFGESQLENGLLRDEENRTAELAEIGFALSSPLFDLREGQRTIILNIHTDTDPNNPSEVEPGQISVRFSGEKDWVKTEIKQFAYAENLITLEVQIDSTSEPVVVFDREILVTRNYRTEFPVMEVILLHDLENNKPFPYSKLKDLTINSIDITVSVDNLTSLIVQSDLGKLDVNKPFQPFGSRPVQGSSFYIGSDEIFRKPVTSMTINADWMDAPANFTEYYEAYFDAVKAKSEKIQLDTSSETGRIGLPSFIDAATKDSKREAVETEISGPISEASIIATVSTLNKNTWEPQKTVPLFNTQNDQLKITFPTSPSDNNIFDENHQLPGLIRYQKDVQQGFVKLELSTPDIAFGHKLYPLVYAKRIVQLINDETIVIPNEPYTPVISNLTLSYSAKSTIKLDDLAQQSVDSFYHIYPFGTLKARSTAEASPGLLPVFQTRVEDVVEENNGELYIGLSDVQPPQMVSLFFKIAEGSADPELNKETIHWSILQDNQWLTLKTRQISFNSTNEFNASGIVSITIPDGIQASSTMLPDGKVWLKAAVLKNTAAVSQLIHIGTQVAEASFYNENNAPDFLANSLAAGSIKKLVVKQSAIKSINQPFVSVDGKAAESGNQFNTRVSERLRHKDRSISIWDYEKIVLQQFSDIYKVKCINHSTYLYELAEDDYFSSEFSPGYITLIVIPNLSNQNAINPLEPRTSLDKLDQIKTFLQQKMTPFAAKKLRVINPLYETIQLEFTVSFYSQYDPAMYLEILNQNLMEFLSPWAFFNTKHKEISFGGKVHRSMLLNFVEEREYVDYISNFKMHLHSIKSDETGVEETGLFDIAEATPATARSIFVSHAQHLITAGDNC